MTEEKFREARNAREEIDKAKTAFASFKMYEDDSKIRVGCVIFDGEIKDRIFNLCIGYLTAKLEEAEKKFESI